VAVGLGAAVAAVLKLPLSGIVTATLMTATAGTGQGPLIIVGVVVAYLAALVITRALPDPERDTATHANATRLPASSDRAGPAHATAQRAT
jgi:hypothetical protein